jgi:hypothetical protein
MNFKSLCLGSSKIERWAGPLAFMLIRGLDGKIKNKKKGLFWDFDENI